MTHATTLSQLLSQFTGALAIAVAVPATNPAIATFASPILAGEVDVRRVAEKKQDFGVLGVRKLCTPELPRKVKERTEKLPITKLYTVVELRS